ncbi:uncharacterized protein LOC143861576 [Tasmannia lanceolata]|uniref:uncharacterized protein LOC143861576 n=1 Tax=Tasmannia lanceolata TaxID=3420 RepID=UPI0040637901
MVGQLDKELYDRDHVLRSLKEQLEMAQARMKSQADKHRTEREFVYLRLQPYRQSTVAVRSNLKLALKFYGPFQIIQRIGPIAYKLLLPASAKIHPVFHVSCLKKKLGSGVPSHVDLSPLTEEGLLQPEPEAILEWRMINRKNQAVTEVLIKWTNMPKEEATWELWYNIQQRFPNFTP